MITHSDNHNYHEYLFGTKKLSDLIHDMTTCLLNLQAVNRGELEECINSK